MDFGTPTGWPISIRIVLVTRCNNNMGNPMITIITGTNHPQMVGFENRVFSCVFHMINRPEDAEDLLAQVDLEAERHKAQEVHSPKMSWRAESWMKMGWVFHF